MSKGMDRWRWWARGGQRTVASIALGGIVLAALVTAVVALDQGELHRERLQRRVEHLAADIQEVVAAHTAVLYGIRSLQVAHGSITRTEFHRFVVDGGLLERYPGAQAFELARRVEAGDLPHYEASVRADTSVHRAGYPQFAVHPVTASQEHWVVEYVEPLEGNERALGLDLGAEADRLAAINDALRDGEPRTTAPLTLVQETENQTGLLILLPLQQDAAVPAARAQRRDRNVDFAVVVYRLGDMVSGIVARYDDLRFELRDLDVADGEAGRRGLLVATGTPDGSVEGATIDVGGRTWELRASTTGPSPAAPALTAVVGLGVTALLCTFIWHLDRARRTAAARARVLAAGDAQRRTLERNLHDGPQQRLVTASMLLGRASERDADVASARSHIDQSLVELRELAAGLHPAVVTDHGLGVALDQLAGRVTVPVEVAVDLSTRPPEAVEVAAYYIASEALTNVAKHAGARRVRVAAAVRDGVLEVAVRDDGCGGAVLTWGRGLAGLADRARALGGTVAIDSGPGHGLDGQRGTTVRAVLPCA